MRYVICNEQHDSTGNKLISTTLIPEYFSSHLLLKQYTILTTTSPFLFFLRRLADAARAVEQVRAMLRNLVAVIVKFMI